MKKIFAFTIMLGVMISLAFAVSAASITGYVKTGSGTAINNALVNFTQAGVEINSTTTNASGFYNLSMNSPAIYNITVSAAGFDPGVDLNVPILGDEERNYTISPAPTGNVSGYVLETNGTGISNATVQLKQGASTVASATSAANGSFSFTNVLANSSGISYNLTAFKTSYNTNTTGIVLYNNTVNNTNVTLSMTLSQVSGYAFYNNSPISGANVDLYDSLGNLKASNQTNASGYYAFIIAGGNYSLIVSSSDGQYQNINQSIGLTNGINTTQNFTLTALGKIGVTVYGSSGLLSGATVTVNYAGAPSLIDKTNGFYETYSIPFGTYTVTISVSGYQSGNLVGTLSTSVLNGTQSFGSITLTPTPITSGGTTGGSGVTTLPYAYAQIANGSGAEFSWITMSAGNNFISITAPQIPLYGVTLVTGTTKYNTKLSVVKLSSLPADVKEVKNAYSILEINKTNINDSELGSVVMQFKVEKSWLTSSSIDSSNVRLSRYKDGSWSDLTTSKMSEDGSYVYYTANSPGFSIFAIYAPETTSCTENWICSDWSVCASQNQIRVCYDTNNCTTETTKPSVSRDCTVINNTPNITEPLQPYIKITSPVNGSTVSFNSADLKFEFGNFTAVRCYYVINDTSVNMTSCANVTIPISSSGLYDLKIVAVDDKNNTYSDSVQFGASIISVDPRLIAVVVVVIVIVIASLIIVLRSENNNGKSDSSNGKRKGKSK